MKTLVRRCERCSTGRMFLDHENIWTCFACGHEVLPFTPMDIPPGRQHNSMYDRAVGVPGSDARGRLNLPRGPR